MKSVARHGPCWSSSLFVFEDCIGDTGKFLPQNTKHCKSSEFMLKAEITIEFLGQTSTTCQLGSQIHNSYYQHISLQGSLSYLVFLAWCCLNCLKIMTAVTSHLLLPGLISEMPPGSPKDIVMQLYGQPDWSSLCLYITFCTFPFISSVGLE